MNHKKLAAGAASVVAAGGIALGVASLATADPSTTPSTKPSGAAASGAAQPGCKGGPGGQGGRSGHTHTAVTGTELTTVTNAVKAKVSGITVTKVEKDSDGSYDVRGTLNGKPVMVEVSKDLKTIEQRRGGPEGKGGPGGQGGAKDTAVTGTEAQSVIAAVKAKDASVSITTVWKDPDGSYDARGTKNGAKIAFDVSKDLKTITERQRR